MLNKIKEFQKVASELGRDSNSVTEFKMWLEAAEKVFPEETVPKSIKPGILLEIYGGDTVKVKSKPYDYMGYTVMDIVFDNGFETTAIWHPEDTRWEAEEYPED